MECSGLHEQSSLRLFQQVENMLVGLIKGAARLVPKRLRRVIENRVFYAIFNSSRVTNDAYGWRPDEEVSDTPEASKSEKK